VDTRFEPRSRSRMFKKITRFGFAGLCCLGIVLVAAAHEA